MATQLAERKFYNCDISVNRSTKSEIIPFCCLSRVCTMGPWKYRSCHGCVHHSVKRISLYHHVIYWFRIVGEWFRIVEHFLAVSLCNVVIPSSVEFWVQSWHFFAGLIPRYWRVPIGFVWSESNGLPFLVVGIVSRIWRAVLRSLVPGLQYRDTSQNLGNWNFVKIF